MRLFIAVLLAGLLGAATPAPAAFLDDIDDVPLMPGLTETADAAVVFETPQGRLVEATVQGPGSVAEVRRFYLETLPQLGWSPTGDLVFRRENETLTLHPTAGADGGVRVRFSLGPAAP